MTVLAKDSGVIWVETLQKTLFCLFQVTFGLILGPKCQNQCGSTLFLVMHAQHWDFGWKKLGGQKIF